MRSIKKLVRSIVNLIKSFSCDTVNGIADGVDEGNVPKVLLNLVMLLSAADRKSTRLNSSHIH